MQTRTALKRLSKGKIDVDQVSPGGPLAQNAEWLIKLHERKATEVKVSQRRHEVAASMPTIESARRKLDDMLKNDVLPDDTPIVSRFDAFSVIKDATRQHANDMGLRKLAIHLERLWHKDPMGALTAGVVSRLRDHYQYSSPRSKVGEVVDTLIPKVSFKTLSVAKLSRIASSIKNQEDYDVAIVRNGLQHNDPVSIRTRTFIRELVNRKADLISEHRTDIPKKVTGEDIAGRIASKVAEDAKELEQDKPENKKDELGVDGTGVLPIAASKAENIDGILITDFLNAQDEMYKCAASTGVGIPKEAVAPPEWEETVKKMKKHKDIESPWALAWWMKGKGYTPGGKESAIEEPTEKTAVEKEPDKAGCAEFTPEVNKQPKDKVKVPKSLKAAIDANNPMVDDKCDHLPVGIKEFDDLALKFVADLNKSPDWWLGSVEELANVVKTAIEAGKLPPALEKFKFDKKGPKKEEKKEEKTKESKTSTKIEKDKVSDIVLSGKQFKAAGYTIYVSDDDTVRLLSKKGEKKYSLIDMDSAIADFIYLVSTEKHPAGSPPQPMFIIKEGMQIKCPKCGEINSYYTPKTASDLSCDSCKTIIPAKVVVAAFNTGAACEEAVLVTYVPTEYQDEFGDKIAHAAEMLNTDSVGVDGCKAEVYAKDVNTDKLAEVWDFMVEAGFRPIAQEVELEEELSPIHEMEEGEEIELAEDVEDIAEDISEASTDLFNISDRMKEMEHHAQAGAPATPTGSPPPTMPAGSASPITAEDAPIEMPMSEGPTSPQWADQQVIQAAMMHYQHQNMDPIEAIVQFKKDYATEKKDETGNVISGGSFDPMAVLQVAAEVYGMDLAQLQSKSYEMSSLAEKKQADIPQPGEINQQQPDVVTPEKLDADSDSKDPGSYGAGKPKTQVDPQGAFAETGIEPDSDNKDPGDFKAEAPKVQHPITDQSGISLAPTELGKDSDTGDNSVTKKMETESGQAPTNMRSAQRGILDGIRSFKKEAQADRNQVYNLAWAAITEAKEDPKLSQYVESIANEWQGTNPDILQQLLDKNVTADYLSGYSLAQMMMGRPEVLKKINGLIQKKYQETPEAKVPTFSAPAPKA